MRGANFLLKVMYYLEDRAGATRQAWYKYLCKRFGHLSPVEKFSALICSRCREVLVHRSHYQKFNVSLKED